MKVLLLVIFLLAYENTNAANYYCAICEAKVSLGESLTDDCFLKPVLTDCKANEYGCYASLTIDSETKSMEFKRSCGGRVVDTGTTAIAPGLIVLESFFSKKGSNCDNGEFLFSNNGLKENNLKIFQDAVKNWQRSECDFTGRI